ncbi:MAG: hypothetical protein LBT04_05315, partial [Prevotellaceae bacterium]|nr:hypothetical protein [Prevotellaceae bacterium]
MKEAEGVLIVNGTPEKSVIFTRMPGSASYWDSIEIWRTGGHIFNNCIFEYGDGNGNEHNLLTSTVKNHKAISFNDLPKQRATTLFNFRVIDKALNFGV